MDRVDELLKARDELQKDIQIRIQKFYEDTNFSGTLSFEINEITIGWGQTLRDVIIILKF